MAFLPGCEMRLWEPSAPGGVSATPARPPYRSSAARSHFAEIGRGLVGALQEVEQHRVRVGGRAHGLVGQDEFAEFRAVVGGAGRIVALGEARPAADRRRSRTPASPKPPLPGQKPQLLTSCE